MTLLTGFFKRRTNFGLMNTSNNLTRTFNKTFEWPPNPGIEGGTCPAGTPAAAVPHYDPNSKGTPAVEVPTGTAAVPITEYATHDLFIADAMDAANTAYLVDGVYRNQIPGSGWCEEVQECEEVNAWQQADFYFEFATPTVVTAADTVKWDVDSSRGNVSPFHGVLVQDGTGLQIVKIHCEDGCRAATGVWGRIDWTPAAK